MSRRSTVVRSASAASSFSIGKYLCSFDFLQIAIMALLLSIGLVFIRSIGEQIGSEYARIPFEKQMFQWIPAGFLLWFLFANLDYRKLPFKIGTLLFFLATTVSLVLVLKYGKTVYGAKRWLYFGSFRFQPSEFGKLSFVLCCSWLLSSKIFSGKSLLGIIGASILLAFPAALIYMEPDLGGTVMLFPIFGAILFVSGLKWRYLLIGLISLLIFFTAFIYNEKHGTPILKSYQRKRIEVFLNPGKDIVRSGYNVNQSRLAVGAGSAWGRGIGHGTQNALGFLPKTVSNNDFIFSVIAEETGFAGCLLLLAIYSGLLYTILSTAFRAELFGRLIGCGIAMIFFCHTYINMGMCIGLAPVSGLPLPFISYGGSFILTGMTALGIMQSIYRHTEENCGGDEK